MANEFKIRKGLIVNGSGSTILEVQGSQGQLFSIVDQLSGSLFSVNDISGVPVLEAFSDTTVKIGLYLSESIVVSGSNSRITGSLFGTASWAFNVVGGSTSFPFSGSAQITGSLGVTGSVSATNFTGSLFGTASWATNFITSSVTSASYAFTASSAVNSTSALTASSADNFVVRQSVTASNALITGTITAQTLVVSTVSSSVVYSSGSNIFGNQVTNVQQFTGSLRVTGSGDHWIVGGNVGIGTTSPNQKLVAVQPSITSYPTLGIGSGGFALLGDSQAYGLYFGINTTTGIAWQQAMRNDAATAYDLLLQPVGGNVGIGTTSPTDFGAGSTLVTTANSTYGGYISVCTTNSVTGQFWSNSSNVYIGSRSNHSLLITTNNTTQLTITPTGEATFVSSVTASGFTKSGGTSAQILAADGTVITAGSNISISGGTISSTGGSGAAFPYTGSAQITGSLGVTGSTSLNSTLNTSAVITSIVGSNTILTQATASYISAFFKYAASSGSNARAGEVIAIWSGSAIQYTDYSTVDIGNTLSLSTTASLSTGTVLFTAQTSLAGWTIKALATYI